MGGRAFVGEDGRESGKSTLAPGAGWRRLGNWLCLFGDPNSSNVPAEVQSVRDIACRHSWQNIRFLWSVCWCNWWLAADVRNGER